MLGWQIKQIDIKNGGYHLKWHWSWIFVTTFVVITTKITMMIMMLMVMTNWDGKDRCCLFCILTNRELLACLPPLQTPLLPLPPPIPHSLLRPSVTCWLTGSRPGQEWYPGGSQGLGKVAQGWELDGSTRPQQWSNFHCNVCFFLVMECQCFLGYKDRRGSTAQNCQVKVNFMFLVTSQGYRPL